MYTVNSITLPMLTSYLKRKNWHQLDVEIDLPITVWKHRDIQNIALSVPQSPALSDYASAMKRIISELAIIEGCSAEEVLTAMHNQDTIRIRVIGDDVENGTIPLNDGSTLFKSAEALVKSAAKKMFKGKKGNTKTQQVNAFMDTVLLGQTQVDSYAISIITPATVAETEQVDFNPVPTGEMLNSAIYKALSSLKSAIHQYREKDDILQFANSSSDGADVDICHAIVQMSGEKKERSVEIKLGQNQAEIDDRTVFFSAEEIQPVQEAYNFLSGRDYTLKAQHYVGQIAALKKEPDSNSGKVTINAFIFNKPKKISFILTGSEYALAIDAHKKAEYVLCAGDIHVTRTSAEIIDLSIFKVIEQPELNT